MFSLLDYWYLLIQANWLLLTENLNKEPVDTTPSQISEAYIMDHEEEARRKNIVGG